MKLLFTTVFTLVLTSVSFSKTATATGDDAVIGRYSIHNESNERKTISGIAPGPTTQFVPGQHSSTVTNRSSTISPKTFVYFLDNFTQAIMELGEAKHTMLQTTVHYQIAMVQLATATGTLMGHSQVEWSTPESPNLPE